jgi:hypothetical protein
MGSRLPTAAMMMLLAAACARSEKAPGAALAARDERVMGLWTVRNPQIAPRTSRRVAAVAVIGLAGAALFGLWHRPS